MWTAEQIASARFGVNWSAANYLAIGRARYTALLEAFLAPVAPRPAAG